MNLLLPAVFAFTIYHFLPVCDYLISSIGRVTVGEADLVGYLLTFTMLFDEGVQFLLVRAQGSVLIVSWNQELHIAHLEFLSWFNS